jgi:hypothetical protein
MSKALYFSKVIAGETVTMAATTEEDKVRFVYDGWRDITDAVTAAREVAKQFPADAAPAKPADAPVKK